jgi:DNA polymerase/3'-5' exonuclease PolX
MLSVNSDIESIDTFLFLNNEDIPLLTLEYGNSFSQSIRPFCTKVELCGSIRRKKANVNDIDIVAITNNIYGLASKIKSISEKIDIPKNEVTIKTQLFRVIYKGEQVDLYLANNQNYEVIRLVRTGSAEHNVKLCKTAIRKGMHLNFAMGLIDGKKNVVDDTEEGIITELLDKYVKPEERE